MSNLVYLSYGQGQHVQEIVFSVLTARYFLRGAEAPRIVIYTDNPAPFANLHTTIELLTPEILQDWLGPHDYIHRRKIMAIGHALRKYGSTLFLDSDTYFTKSPTTVLRRITPRQSVMHLREGPLKHLREHSRLTAPLCRAPFEVNGITYRFTPNWGMWNSGVIGIDAANSALIDQAVALNDQIQERERNDVSEQVAFARVLQDSVRLLPADDAVFHYWRDYLRRPFSQRITGFLPQSAPLPLEDRAICIYPHRPRPDWKKHLRSTAKTMLHAVGITHVGLRSNG